MYIEKANPRQVFNMVTQGDSTINLRTSHRMSRDSSSIHTLTVLDMVFLPGTFTAVYSLFRILIADMLIIQDVVFLCCVPRQRFRCRRSHRLAITICTCSIYFDIDHYNIVVSL
jgi:hypothetical protein